jgi:F-type H+-transporting ATPase subunit delta
MNDSKISVRYSRALFQLALEKKLLDEVFVDMRLIAELCGRDDMKNLLESPMVAPSKKRKIFKDILGTQVQEITMSLINLVIKNGRESYLPAIARRFVREIKDYKGITETSITTAVKLEDNIVKQVEEFVAKTFNTKVELKQNVDKDIIGGFILKVDDSYVDASVRGKLRTIEKELKEATLTA